MSGTEKAVSGDLVNEGNLRLKRRMDTQRHHTLYSVPSVLFAWAPFSGSHLSKEGQILFSDNLENHSMFSFPDHDFVTSLCPEQRNSIIECLAYCGYLEKVSKGSFQITKD